MGIKDKSFAIAVLIGAFALSGFTIGCGQQDGSLVDDDTSPVEIGITPGNPVTGGSGAIETKPTPETPAPAPSPVPTPAPATGGTIERFRSEVVRVAKAEAALGLCGSAATTKYLADSGSAWCSEFARWVFIQAGTMTDSTSSLMNLTGWSRFRTFFTNKGRFLSRTQLTREGSTGDLMTGNYLLLDTDLDGEPNHSALIVGVSADLASVYTVEGNVSNCTKSLTRKFWSGSSLDSKIIGIGVIWE